MECQERTTSSYLGGWHSSYGGGGSPMTIDTSAGVVCGFGRSEGCPMFSLELAIKCVVEYERRECLCARVDGDLELTASPSKLTANSATLWLIVGTNPLALSWRSNWRFSLALIIRLRGIDSRAMKNMAIMRPESTLVGPLRITSFRMSRFTEALITTSDRDSRMAAKNPRTKFNSVKNNSILTN